MKKSMQKLLAKTVAIVLSVVTACGVGLGCGDKSDSKKTLTIRVSNTGFGVDCIEAVANAFAKLEGINVKVEGTVVMKSDLNKLLADYKMEDVFFVSGTEATEVIRAGKFVEIDDVWNATPDGESVAIKDKTFDVFKDDYMWSDGHYYSMPFETQLGGMAYNKNTLDMVYGEGKWSLPVTTEELTTMAQEVTDGGKAWGVIYTTSQPYWEMPSTEWAMQYHGIEEYTKLISGYYQKEDGSWEFSQNGECLEQMTGTLRTYEALYPLMNKNSGVVSQYCGSMNFMEMQVAFAGLGYGQADKKQIAFTPTGSWLYNENREDFIQAKTTPGFFNVVLSAIVEKLSFYNEDGNDFYSLSKEKRASYDKALSEIIAYVDATENGESVAVPTTANGYSVTEADIARVTEARRTRFINSQPKVGITHNSENIELAKKFLIFYASDYAAQIYSNNTHGISPFSYTKYEINENSSLFDKDVKKMLTGTINLVPSSEHKPYGSLLAFSIEQNFYDATGNYNTPEKAFNNMFITQNKNSWKKIVRESGNADKLKD